MNFCEDLLHKTKKHYFQSLSIRDLSDSRKFCKITKPRFTNKGLNSNKLFFTEKQLPTVMNTSFINITKVLDLKEHNESNENTLKDVLDSFSSYLSIERFKRTVKT